MNDIREKHKMNTELHFIAGARRKASPAEDTSSNIGRRRLHEHNNVPILGVYHIYASLALELRHWIWNKFSQAGTQTHCGSRRASRTAAPELDALRASSNIFNQISHCPFPSLKAEDPMYYSVKWNHLWPGLEPNILAACKIHEASFDLIFAIQIFQMCAEAIICALWRLRVLSNLL